MGGSGEPVNATDAIAEDAAGGLIKLIDFYAHNGVAPGADFLVIGNGSIGRSGEIAALLTSIGDDSGPAVHRLVIVLPPGEEENIARPLVEAGYVRQFAEIPGAPEILPTEKILPRRIHFESAASFDAASIVEIVERGGRQSAFIVPQAARYRRLLAPREPTEVPEDIWVPQLHALGEDIVGATRENGAYVALDAGEWWPERKEHQDLLLTVEHCGVVHALSKRARPLEQRTLRKHWQALAVQGNVSLALEEIERHPDLLADERIENRLTVFATAGLSTEVEAEFRRAERVIDAMRAEGILVLAEPALTAGLKGIARALLTRSIPALTYPESLQLALRLADKLGDADVIKLVETLVQERHPGSPVLSQRNAMKLLAEGRRVEAAAIMDATLDPELAEEAAFQRWLDIELQRVPFDPTALLAACHVAFPMGLSAALRTAALTLERQRRRVEALDLLLAGPHQDGELDRLCVRAAIEMLERGILTLDPACDDDANVAVVGAVVRWLAQNPSDGFTRLKLAELLSPQMIGGPHARATIAMVVITLGQQEGYDLPPQPAVKRVRPCDPELLPAVLEAGLEFLTEHPASVLGRWTFPVEKLNASADEVVSGFIEMMEYAGEAYADKTDARLIENCLGVATAVAKLGTRPDDDLLLLRMAAGRLALNGDAQRARDLAEHALTLADGSPRRARIAWQTFGDLYQRTGNAIEGFIGLACALAGAQETDWDQIWYEALLGIRLFRDIGIYRLLAPMIEKARTLVERGGLPEHLVDQLDTIHLQVRMGAVEQQETNAGELASIMSEAVLNFEAVEARGDDVGPVTVLLASAARIARDKRIAVPEGVDAKIAAGRAKVGAGTRALLAVTTDSVPAVEDLAYLASELAVARHADDVGFDLRHLALGAERVLGAGTSDPEAAAFAIEIMADLGLPLPDREHIAGPPKQLSEPANNARAVVSEGLSVVMLALTANGLTRVEFTGSDERVTAEETALFSEQALEQWEKTYPHAYWASTGERSHDFFTSTRHLGVSRLPQRAVIIASTPLQAIPPNILQIDQSLAGDEHRLALAPSMEWLSAARRTPFSGDGKVRAWIPDAVPESGSSALAVLAERLQNSFDTHGIQLFGGEEAPPELSGSDMVVIGAHGGVGEDTRYFRVVTDDVDLALAASAVSGVLTDIGVVVLFVCSGGRIDKHPGASTTVGLAKQLLSSGCRAVVAPPWPLATSVPPYWLPTFLDRWMAGETVLDACFDANAAVRDARGHEPAAHLAMTVYGDPLIRHQITSADGTPVATVGLPS